MRPMKTRSELKAEAFDLAIKRNKGNGDACKAFRKILTDCFRLAAHEDDQLRRREVMLAKMKGKEGKS